MFNTLLVTDDITYRQTLADILLWHFPLIDVDEANNGWEALRKVEYRRPNLIFMDIHLPEEYGLNVTQEIKRIYDGIVIVILSTNNQLEYRQRAFRNGADYFISKRDDTYLEKILARIDVALARASHQ